MLAETAPEEAEAMAKLEGGIAVLADMQLVLLGLSRLPLVWLELEM